MLVTGCQATAAIALNPLNFTGPVFLIFYLALTVIVIVISGQIRTRLLRNTKAEQKINKLNPYEIAHFVSGKERTIETAIVSLIQKGIVTARVEQNSLALEVAQSPLKKTRHLLEYQIANAIAPNSTLNSLKNEKFSALKSIEAGVPNIMPPTSTAQWFFAQYCSMLPVLALLGLGISKIVVGLSRDKPVGYLATICFFIIVGAYTIINEPYLQAQERNYLILNLKRTHRRSRTFSYQDPRILKAFAISGSIALPKEKFGLIKEFLNSKAKSTKRRSSSSSTGYASTNSNYSSNSDVDYGGGDSGCGGGGCGGCGGCGD